MPEDSPSRRDIVWVDFPEADDQLPDAEFEDPHPGIVLQQDDMHDRVDSTIVIPVSKSRYDKPRYMREQLLEGEHGVNEDCYAHINEIVCVSVPERITNKDEWRMGEVPKDKMKIIERRIRQITGV